MLNLGWVNFCANQGCDNIYFTAASLEGGDSIFLLNASTHLQNCMHDTQE